jgi:hypothetical protein
MESTSISCTPSMLDLDEVRGLSDFGFYATRVSIEFWRVMYTTATHIDTTNLNMILVLTKEQMAYGA